MAQQENELTEPFVKWIESEMARRGWKQADLGRRANVRPDVLSRMISRENAPEVETLKAIARAFGLSLQELQVSAINGLRDDQQDGSWQSETRRSARAPSSNTSGESGDEDAAYLDYTLRTLRHLDAAQREGASVGVQLLILQQAEEIGVEKFGPRPKAFIERERARLQRGETLGGVRDRSSL